MRLTIVVLACMLTGCGNGTEPEPEPEPFTVNIATSYASGSASGCEIMWAADASDPNRTVTYQVGFGDEGEVTWEETGEFQGFISFYFDNVISDGDVTLEWSLLSGAFEDSGSESLPDMCGA